MVKVIDAPQPEAVNEDVFAIYEQQVGTFKEELFARGFIMSDDPPAAPRSWAARQMDGLFIRYHPSLQCTQSHAPRAALLCLGILFDSRFPGRSQNECLDHLVDALEQSEDSFLEELSHTNGRYVLIYRRRDGQHYILTDAAGIRGTLFHRGRGRTICSHLALLAVGPAKHETPDNRPFKFGFPGRMTPLSNVYLLTPNTKLHFESFRPERYWPTKEIISKPLEYVADFIGERLFNSYQWLRTNFDPFITITAGIDSRVTLAIAQKNGRYATYYRSDEQDTDKIDLETTISIARSFNLDHTILTRENWESAPEEYKNLININTFRKHLPGVAFAYRNVMVRDPQKSVHIRSNLSEIGRRFYQWRNVEIRTPDDLVRVWTNNPKLHTPENISAFREYAEATGFMSAPVELTSLFYWEHRMGSWHSQVALESDIACESLSLYNCRALLASMWSVPEEDQKKSKVLKHIVATRWPELVNFPLNGKPFDYLPDK